MKKPGIDNKRISELLLDVNSNPDKYKVRNNSIKFIDKKENDEYTKEY